MRAGSGPPARRRPQRSEGSRLGLASRSGCCPRAGQGDLSRQGPCRQCLWAGAEGRSEPAQRRVRQGRGGARGRICRGPPPRKRGPAGEAELHLAVAASETRAVRQPGTAEDEQGGARDRCPLGPRGGSKRRGGATRILPPGSAPGGLVRGSRSSSKRQTRMGPAARAWLCSPSRPPRGRKRRPPGPRAPQRAPGGGPSAATWPPPPPSRSPLVPRGASNPPPPAPERTRRRRPVGRRRRYGAPWRLRGERLGGAESCASAGALAREAEEGPPPAPGAPEVELERGGGRQKRCSRRARGRPRVGRGLQSGRQRLRPCSLARVPCGLQAPDAQGPPRLFGLRCCAA
ncbi:proline-rich proteoglycan 2-like [Eublepharis macularius]|uniref:Proline-rich proteoglycan 2-like n=1 Tax=Eublepharis macularius TaxID=481883 RepID=A0AA97K7U7_EUBMA|nr:proline-rich proteoglycan 2-like [Eublepharis macularius]